MQDTELDDFFQRLADVDDEGDYEYDLFLTFEEEFDQEKHTTAAEIAQEIAAIQATEENPTTAAATAYVHESASRKRVREEEGPRSFRNILPVRKFRKGDRGSWRVYFNKIGSARKAVWQNGFETPEEAARAADQFLVAVYGARVREQQLNFPDESYLYMAPGGVADDVFALLRQRGVKSNLPEYWERVKSRGYIQ